MNICRDCEFVFWAYKCKCPDYFQPVDPVTGVKREVGNQLPLCRHLNHGNCPGYKAKAMEPGCLAKSCVGIARRHNRYRKALETIRDDCVMDRDGYLKNIAREALEESTDGKE